MIISQNIISDSTRHKNKIVYSESEYQANKAKVKSLATIFGITKQKKELATISRIFLIRKYGKKHMSNFLCDFEEYFHDTVEYVFSVFKGNKNNMSLFYAVVIAIGMLDNVYDALLLIEAAGFPFNNTEYLYVKELLIYFYSNNANLKLSTADRIRTIGSDELYRLNAR